MKLKFNSQNNLVTLILLASSFSIEAQTYLPGQTCFDTSGYIEYRVGNLPIVLSAPHGGDWSPDSIPNRDSDGCVYAMDLYTRLIAEGVYQEIHDATGCYPHLIINRLHRRKLDANRDIGDAADGNPAAEQAWYGYHAFIDTAKAMIAEENDLYVISNGKTHLTKNIEDIETLGYARMNGND